MAQQQEHAALVDQLYLECRHRNSYSRQLRVILERLPCADRRKLVHATAGHRPSPFSVAIILGKMLLVRYMVTVCKADANTPMEYESDDGRIRWVPPIFTLIDSNADMPMLRQLVQLGAKVNVSLRDGLTALWWACRKNRWTAARFLVRQRAEVNVANGEGDTCLMECVSNASLVEMVLLSGAAVNARQASGGTALHLAAMQNCADSIFQLLRSGADPTTVNYYNHDALQAACISGHREAYEVLSRNVAYTVEQRIAAHELLGSSLWILHNNELGFWHLEAALELRDKYAVPKVLLGPRPEYGMAVEFNSTLELRQIRHSDVATEFHCLMVCERLLGTQVMVLARHWTISGVKMFQAGHHRIAMSLFGLSMRLHPAVCAYFCAAAQANIHDLCEAVRRCVLVDPVAADRPANFAFVRYALLDLTGSIGEMRATLDVRPQSPDQQFGFEAWFAGAMFMVYAIVQLALMGDDQEMRMMHRLVDRLLAVRLDTSINRVSMLHHSVMAERFGVFPSIHVTRVLLFGGADVNATTRCRCTPLHLVCAADEPDEDLIQLLLDYGAHIEQPNASGQRPIDRIRHMPRFQARISQFRSLRCIAATAVAQLPVLRSDELPADLTTVVRQHSSVDATTPAGRNSTEAPGIPLGDARRFCRCEHPVFGAPLHQAA